jgi:hypothetical protein
MTHIFNYQLEVPLMKSTLTKIVRGAAWAGGATLLVASLVSNRAAATPMEEWSQSLTPGLSTQNEFVMVFSGNQTASIPTQTAASYDDPFASPTINVAYNGGLGETIVTFSGSGSIGNSSPVQVGLSNLAEGVMATELGAYWENTSDSSTAAAPVLEISPTPSAAVAGYAILYLDYDPPSTPQPTYYEFSYQSPANLANILLKNPNNAFDAVLESFTSSPTSGFLLSNTLIPLDDLNFNDEPPPGNVGSMFNPIPDPPSLSAGSSEDISVPEPGSIALLGMAGCMLGLAGFRRRMNQAA